MHRKLEDHLILHINPGSINHFAKLKPWYRKFRFLKNIGLGGVYGLFKSEPGLIYRQSLKTRPFTEHEKYIFLKELWDSGYDFTQTTRYQKFIKQLDAGETISMPVKGYTIADANDLSSYFQDYVDLLKSMSNSGYLPEKSRQELLIIIGPCGELIKTSKGRHRLAAARIAGVPVIPVKVRHIHADWINKNQPETGRGLTLEKKIITALDKIRRMHSL